MDLSAEIGKYVDPDKMKAQDPEVFSDIFENNGYGLFHNDISGKSILDIGANIGCFSLFSVLLGAKRVVAVEPNPSNFSNLQSNLASCAKIKLLRLAVSGAPQVLWSHGSGSNAMVSEEPSEMKVESRSLGQLLEEFPGEDDIFMKVDCEGMEYDFLLSASRRELDRIGTLTVEIHTGGPFAVSYLMDYIKFMGFKVEWMQPLLIFFHDKNGKIVDRLETGTAIIKFRRNEK